LAEPTKVAPMTTVSGCGNGFVDDFPANAITFIRLSVAVAARRA
jgi:hypothetical protein